MNNVIVDVFKDNGKWYERIEFKTNNRCFDWFSVYKEFLLNNNNYKDYDLVIYISNKDNTVASHRLITKKLN